MGMEKETPETPYSKEERIRAQRKIDMGSPRGLGFLEYAKVFQFSSTDFAHKRVLDLGAGLHLRFGSELKDLGNDLGTETEIVSYSPAFENKHVRATALANARPDVSTQAVAGMGEQLPFKDASFDTIVCTQVFQYVPLALRMRFLKEAVRVLAGGGTAYIGPIDPLAREEIDALADEAREQMHAVITIDCNKAGIGSKYILKIRKDYSQ